MRREKIARAIKELVSKIVLYELKDPRLGFVTITHVEVSGDLRCAKVKVSVMGDDVKQKLTMRALKHARGYVQNSVAHQLGIRFAPELRFDLDQGVKRSIRLAELLRDAVENT